MSKDIKKALEHCIEWNCANCPNREELGSGETVCRGRLLPEVLEYVADLEAKLAESEKENKTLKDIRTLERVVPRNAQLHKLSNRDCYLKGFENAISETIRTFEETYGKEKCKLIEERDKYLMDIVKAGGYEYQIEELKQKLAEKEKEIEYQESMKILAVGNQNKKAIEQLNKVKEKALHFYVNDTPKLTGFYVDVNEIDNQIAELTHQHEDKGE